MIPGKIGVGITTKGRPALLKYGLEQGHRKFLPEEEFSYIIVNDGGEPMDLPYWYTEFARMEFDESRGIASAKNSCIQILMHEGCEHFFLFDDDAWPKVQNWHLPYLESDQPHLMSIFPWKTRRSVELTELYHSDELVAYHGSRGYMLYLHRSVIEKVGGFDTRFQYGFEHVEYSNRIHNAGLTLFRYQDVPKSENLIWSEDSTSEATSVITELDRRRYTEDNIRLLSDCEGRITYVPYQYPVDVILTCLFTKHKDPQRDTKWDPDTSLLKTLIESTQPHNLVIFHDEIELTFEMSEALKYIKEDYTIENPYFQRWISYRKWLIDHPQARWVWCVDGTDVELRKDPFPDWLREDTLYCGWENAVCGSQWMRFNHEYSFTWLRENADLALLNAGVVGGSRDTILKLSSLIIEHYSYSLKEKKKEIGDMGIFQRVARTWSESGNLETGPIISTLFKGNEPPERNTWSMWKHK